ncbi:MAG: polysulfide reductase NrfD [Chloroflexi bacterium]|nr:polysulfide reductase NrfD [Chloroflexota bacterium]
MDTFDIFVVKSKVQREWSWLILTAFFLGGVGGGLYLVAMFSRSVPGMVAGLLIVIVGKSTAHLLFLGRPERFWRIFASPQTSWISRGLYIVAAFSIFGVLYVAPLLWPSAGIPWTVDSTLGRGIQGISILASLLLIIYTGFVMAYSPAIQFWATPLLPALFGLYSLSAGTATMLITTYFTGERQVDFAGLATLEMVLISAALAFVAIYLATMLYSTVGAKEAAAMLTRGELAVPFWIGVVLVGLTIPLATVFYLHFFGTEFSPLVVVAAVLELVGGFLLRHCLLRAGVFAPVI